VTCGVSEACSARFARCRRWATLAPIYMPMCDGYDCTNSRRVGLLVVEISQPGGKSTSDHNNGGGDIERYLTSGRASTAIEKWGGARPAASAEQQERASPIEVGTLSSSWSHSHDTREGGL